MVENFVSLDWAPGNLVGVDFVKARRAVVPIKQVPFVPGIKGATILVAHSSGPRLITAAAKAVSDGGAAEVIVQSPGTSFTKLTGLAAITLRVWNSGDPAGHPIERILPYVDGASIKALTDLVGTIFDPVWFQYPTRVDEFADARPSRVEAWLGLTPRWDRTGSLRRSLVTASWRTYGSAGKTFFDRIFHDFTYSGSSTAAAERKAGRFFIRCLLASWLDRKNGGDPLFDPSVMFGRRLKR